MTATDTSQLATPAPVEKLRDLQQEGQGIDPIYNEALEHMRATAALGRSLVAGAVKFVPTIEATIETEESIRRNEHEANNQVSDTVKRFFTSLPQAVEIRQERGYPPNYYEVPADSLEEAKLLQSQLWWLPVDQKHPQDVGFHRDSWALFNKWNEGFKSKINKHYAVPYMVIGQTAHEVNPDESDAYVELLLYPLTEDESPVVVVRASSRLFDVAEEFSLGNLSRMITSVDELQEFRKQDGSFKVPNGFSTKNRLQFDKYGGAQDPKLVDEPRSERRKAKYWDRMENRIRQEGLQVSLVDVYDGVGRETFEKFDVPFHTLKLATMLDRETEYGQSIGTLKAQR